MEHDRLAYWYGRPIAKMTREELVDALNVAARLYHNKLTEAAADAKYVVAGKIAEWSR